MVCSRTHSNSKSSAGEIGEAHTAARLPLQFAQCQPGLLDGFHDLHRELQTWLDRVQCFMKLSQFIAAILLMAAVTAAQHSEYG